MGMWNNTDRVSKTQWIRFTEFEILGCLKTVNIEGIHFINQRFLENLELSKSSFKNGSSYLRKLKLFEYTITYYI